MSNMVLLSRLIQEYISFVSNLENSCNVYNLFPQYGYDQYTLIRNADNLVKPRALIINIIKDT